MTFSLNISGHASDPDTAQEDQQTLIDDLRAVVGKHTDKITYATGNFQYEGDIDLLPPAPPVVVPPVDTPPVVTPPVDTPPVVTPPPVVEPPAPVDNGFVDKISGESFVDYQTRLFVFNEGKDPSAQAVPLTPDQWFALAPSAPASDPSAPTIAAPVEAAPVDAGPFVLKLAGEDYGAYVARATAAGATTVMDLAPWNALEVGTVA